MYNTCTQFTKYSLNYSRMNCQRLMRALVQSSRLSLSLSAAHPPPLSIYSSQLIYTNTHLQFGIFHEPPKIEHNQFDSSGERRVSKWMKSVQYWNQIGINSTNKFFLKSRENASVSSLRSLCTQRRLPIPAFRIWKFVNDAIRIQFRPSWMHYLCVLSFCMIYNRRTLYYFSISFRNNVKPEYLT